MSLPRTVLLIALASAALLGCDSESASGPGKPGSSASSSAAASASASAAKETSVKGVDTSNLTPRERRDWMAQVGELLAPCPEVPVSIAQCVNEARPCKTCLPAAQFLARQVQAGRAKKEREEAFRARFDAGKVKPLDIDGSPSVGPSDAAVTIIEWADFQCPFCRLVSPMLDEIVARFDGQVRLVFKFYPLSGHPQGEIAARAAVAAMNQGKFWEMHHLMFENQERLEQADLEKYAKQLKLDVARFRKDLTAADTTERIEKDKKRAEELGLEGTPFLFVNGREADLSILANPYDDLEEWVRLDIELAGQTPRPRPAKLVAPPSPSGSASAGSAPSASAAPRPSAAPSAGKP
jgi:protein-disulfide isomerase